MKRSTVLVTIGDGMDPRSEELREQSRAIAEAGRAATGNASEDMYATKTTAGKSSAVVRWSVTWMTW